MNRLHKAITYYRQGTLGRWKAALVASRLNRGELEPLAEELAVTTRAVRDLRAAGRAYRRLRKLSSELPKHAMTLSVSHFAKVGNLIHEQDGSLKEDVDLRGIIEDIRIAADMRSNVIEFSQALQNVYGEDETDQWRGWLDKMYKNAVRVMDGYGAPDHIKRAARDFVRVYNEWQEEETHA